MGCIICWLEVIKWNQSINRTQFDVTLWKPHKLFRYIFFSLTQNFILMCFNNRCSFKYKMADISFIPLVSSAKTHKYKSINPENVGAKATSASQDMSHVGASHAMSQEVSGSEEGHGQHRGRCARACGRDSSSSRRHPGSVSS